MRVLVLDDNAQAEIKRVKAFALANRRNLHAMMRTMNGQDIPGDDQNYRAEFFDGWKVVYTVEQHPGGWFHHFSASIIPRKSKQLYPHPLSVDELLKQFSLPSAEKKSHGWIEDIPDGSKAVNLLFPFVEPL